jgi:hypothetical protein
MNKGNFSQKVKLSNIDQSFTENYIIHDVSNDIDFVLCMLIIYSVNLIKLYIVWLFRKKYMSYLIETEPVDD